MTAIGFDTEKYLTEQSKQIMARVSGKEKLYIEFGGKLISDKHAARVLPGFEENAKIRLLEELKDQTEVIICVYAGDIEQNKIRSDYGITYDQEVMRLIDEYREREIEVNSVLLTRYRDQKNAEVFVKNLENRDIEVYIHREIEGYPTDIDAMFSNEGFAKNSFIPTDKPLVVVTGPGAGSGKLATCLSQMYHEYERGISAGYAKFETFPVWNLPLRHPVNAAYEASTVDLKDTNVLDNYHYEAYGEVAVNYNRDVKMFPIVKKIIEMITGEDSIYQSPTDMGVNCIKEGITDNEVIEKAANQEIIRRYFYEEVAYLEGTIDEETRSRMHMIMEENNLRPEDRAAVVPAREYADELQMKKKVEYVQSVMAIELSDGKIIKGRRSRLMDASAACIMNSLKYLAGIGDRIDLLAPTILETIQKLKADELHSKVPTLALNELLIALAISAVTNPTADLAYKELKNLKGGQAHSTVILSMENTQSLKRLGIDVTSDTNYLNNQMYNP